MALTNTRAASTPARYRTFETPWLRLFVDLKSDRTAHVTKIIQDSGALASNVSLFHSDLHGRLGLAEVVRDAE